MQAAGGTTMLVNLPAGLGGGDAVYLLSVVQPGVVSNFHSTITSMCSFQQVSLFWRIHTAQLDTWM